MSLVSVTEWGVHSAGCRSHLMHVLGIIPARGGSVGIPRKNLAIVGGKTLLARAIESAYQAKRITRLIVSTDCREIADEAQRLNCAVEFRPDELATAEATTLSVLQWHVRNSDSRPDAVLCLQPTCPLRRASDIDGAISVMERTACDSVVSYVPVRGHHPVRMATINDFDRTVTTFGECFAATIDGSTFGNVFAQRQRLQSLYLRSGDVYLTRTSVLLAGDLLGRQQVAWDIPLERHCNIDEPIDLVIAEALVGHHG